MRRPGLRAVIPRTESVCENLCIAMNWAAVLTAYCLVYCYRSLSSLSLSLSLFLYLPAGGITRQTNRHCWPSRAPRAGLWPGGSARRHDVNTPGAINKPILAAWRVAAASCLATHTRGRGTPGLCWVGTVDFWYRSTTNTAVLPHDTSKADNNQRSKPVRTVNDCI